MLRRHGPTQATGEIGDVRFAPDGRIVLVERDWATNQSRVVALDPYGNVLPGWPWTQGDTGDPIAMAELGPEESVYVAVRGAQGDPQTFTWTLHRLDANARELAGFPVALPDVPVCGMAVGRGRHGLPQLRGRGCVNNSRIVTVRAFRPDGSTVSGWPVVLQGGGVINGFRPDGAVVITTVDEQGLADRRDPAGWHVRTGLAPRGSRRQHRGPSTAADASMSRRMTGPRASAAPRPAPPTTCFGSTGPRFRAGP